MQAGGSPEAGHPIQDSDHLPDLWLHRQGEGRVHEQVEGVLQRQRGHCSHDVWHQLRLQKVLLTWKLTNAENSRILEFQKGMMKRMNVLSPCFLRPNKGQKQRWRPFLAERLSQMSLDLVQDDFFNSSVRDETLFSDRQWQIHCDTLSEDEHFGRYINIHLVKAEPIFDLLIIFFYFILFCWSFGLRKINI